MQLVYCEKDDKLYGAQPNQHAIHKIDGQADNYGTTIISIQFKAMCNDWI